MQVDATVRLARDGRADHVHDADDAGADGPRGAHRLERVRRLPRLRDRDRQGSRNRELGPIAVLGGVLHHDGEPRQRFDDVPADKPRVPGRATGDDHDAADPGAGVGGEVEPVEACGARIEQQAPAQRALHRLRLLRNLLQHEVRVAAQLDRLEVPGDVAHLAQLHVGVRVHHVVAVRRQHRDVAVVEVDDRAGVRQHGRGVRSDEELVLTDAEQYRRTLTGHDDLPRLLSGDGGEPVRADDVPQGGGDPFLKGGPGCLFDQVGERLRIGLGAEAVAGPLERRAQGVGVLNDAVVDDGDAVPAVHVRVGVARGGRAVRCPAGVGDAARAGERLAGERVPQPLHPAGELPDRDPSAILDGDAGGVVAAILEPAEALQQDRRRLARTDVPHDAAHRSSQLQV